MTAEQCKQLKAKIKAEMQRRNGYGSLAEYGGSAYDFQYTPTKLNPSADNNAKQNKTLVEHGQKTIDLVLKIEDFKDLKLVQENDPIPEAFGQDLINEVDRLANENSTGESRNTVNRLYPSRTPESSSCRGACTGLCVGTCIGHCNGCDSCTATCSANCHDGCQGCKNSCQGQCTGCSNCSGSCANGCGGCTGNCNGGCRGHCTGGCKSGCGGGCSGHCNGAKD